MLSPPEIKEIVKNIRPNLPSADKTIEFFSSDEMKQATSQCRYLADKIFETESESLQKEVSPVLLITFGPPASGKGSCIDKFFDAAKEYGFNPSNYISINLDAIIDQLDTDKEVLKDPAAYFYFRQCADEIVKTLFMKSIDAKLSIMSETTGTRKGKWWTYTKEAKKQGYKVVVLYPLVTKNVLLERSRIRAEKIGRSPDVKSIEDAIKNAPPNLSDLYGIADKIVLYDNSTSTPCKDEVITCKDNECKGNLSWILEELRGKFDTTFKFESAAAAAADGTTRRSKNKKKNKKKNGTRKKSLIKYGSGVGSASDGTKKSRKNKKIKKN